MFGFKKSYLLLGVLRPLDCHILRRIESAKTMTATTVNVVQKPTQPLFFKDFKKN
jgi:hypothetical protein